jgi:hypothetical protein
MRKYVLSALLAAAVIVPSYAADSPQKPGKWKITVQMEMAGMAMPPMNFEKCITAEDLKDPQKAVPTDPKSKCTVGDYKIDGKKITWTVDCPAQKTHGNGEMTFSDDQYTGWMKLAVQDHEMTTKYSGKWMGECSK